MAAAPQVKYTSAGVPDTTPLTVTWELVHAEPGALVYAVPGVKPAANPRVRRTATRPGGWTPSGTPEHTATSHHGEIEHPVLHYAGYIGRVGVLAAALGVGAAVAGTPGRAWAEPNAGDSTTSSEPSTMSASNETPAPQAGLRNGGGRTTAARQHSSPTSVLRGSGEVRTSSTGATDAASARRTADSPRLPAAAAPAQRVPTSGSESPHTDSSASGTPASLPAPPTDELQTTGPAPRIPAALRATDIPTGEPTMNPRAADATTPAPAASTGGVTNRIVSAVLAPFSAHTATPATPANQAAQTPVLYGLFAWLRRTFDYQTPTRASDPTGNTQVGNARSSGAPASATGVADRTTFTVAGELHAADLDPETLVYSVAGGPSRGTVTLNPTTGAFTYTPFQTNRPHATADQLHDTFIVTVHDSHGTDTTVPVSVDLDPTGAARVTTLAVHHPGTRDTVHMSVIVADPDTEAATYLVVHDPAQGTRTQATGDFSTYTVTAEAAPAAARVARVAAATAVTTSDVILEGESLVLTPAKAGSRYSDSTASGRQALLMSTNGTASATVSLPASTKLVIRAKGDQYKGAPAMTVSLDGKVISTISVSSTTWTDFTVPITASAGTHTVSIAYANELRASASKDRNLRIDKITVVASPVTPPSTQTPAYFPTADWLWKPIPANPTLASNSATWVGYLSAPQSKHVTELYEEGTTLIPASAITTSSPRYDVNFTQTGAWGSDPFGSYTVPIPVGTVVAPYTRGDAHLAVQDPATGQVFGIWQARYNRTTNTWTGSWGGMTPINGNG
ncbi:MAG: carbohydrate-binding domain-containing protein, partial [Mycobacteriaceae bacterium]